MNKNNSIFNIKNWGLNKKWYIKIILFFIRKKYYTDNIENKQIEYKILFGKYYFIDIYNIPPIHMNCRCSLILN